MAEENREPNAAQPQDNEQQTVPMQPVESAPEQAQTSHESGETPKDEQPTITLPVNGLDDSDKADQDNVAAAAPTNDSEVAPNYAAAAGESTVVGGPTPDASETSANSPYRPAPEYGAYGPVPTQPAQQTGANGNAAPGQPQYGAYGQPQGAPTQQMPPQNGNPFFGNPYANDDQQGNTQQNNGNPFLNPQGQNGEGVPPTPNNGNPFGNPFGAPNQPNQPGQPGRPKRGVFAKAAKSKHAGQVVTVVVAALVSAGLCLGVGFTAISNGWVSVPSSNSLANVKSNTSGSGSATAKTGKSIDWSAVAKEVSDSVVAIDVATSDGEAKGSGAIVDTKGYIVTNNHVISGAQQIQVTLANGTIYSAKLVGTDTTTDLAVIKLENPPSDLTAVKFADSDNLAVGEGVMAIGNPLGYDDTATTGIVSALNRPVTVTDDDNNAIVTNAVQIDAAINPGNSGGPTFNAAGQVIGINSSIASTASSSGTAGSIGIGFAIPSNLVKRVANEIIDNGSVKHVALGITIKSSSVEADGVTRGCAQVQSVVDGGPASKAGVKAGDSIVAFNGKAVNNNYSLLGYVRASALNDKVKLTVVRDGHTVDLDVTLDQEESKSTSSSNSQNDGNSQNDQNGQGDSGNGSDGSNGYDNSGNGDGSGSGSDGDNGGLFDPFGMW